MTKKARQPTKKDKPKKDRLRISKETVKDLDPDSRGAKVRGGAPQICTYLNTGCDGGE